MTNPSHYTGFPRCTGPEQHWSELGNCSGVHPTTMFPERGDMAGWREARKVCEGCPVIEPCREASVDEMHGMWAGMSPKERQQLRVKRDWRRRSA